YPFLSRHDSNSFVRYESMHSYGIETLDRMMKSGDINNEFVETYGYILDANLNLSFKALLLELPSISTLMQRQEVVDFEPIYEAKEKLQKHLASVYKGKLLSIYYNNHIAEDDSIEADSMDRRSIKNRVLKLLSMLGSQDVIDLAKNQYDNSSTMTDKIAALDILENTTQKEGSVALNHFYNKYKNDTLVMNKYFAILAASERDGTLDRVMALQNDEVYDEKIPNLVRSLIGVFARNYKHFHAKNGLGYKFVADKIIEIDKINAQMASALAGAFKIYEKMNEINKKLIQAELERVVSTHSLSKNCYEIVSKILKK
ncbi:MAG: aminopeptidase N C-terminal domain-containing protein, partial [Thiovulaceae bacterium]|nr:aminopeptidase N C-terminal domain-containing protein [Sulfurimonadaceae bacterium]